MYFKLIFSLLQIFVNVGERVGQEGEGRDGRAVRQQRRRHLVLPFPLWYSVVTQLK